MTTPPIFNNLMPCLMKFPQLVISPVKNIFLAINLTLALIIIALATVSARTWTTPKYPRSIEAASVVPDSKTLEPLTLKRKFNNSGTIATIVRGNLFRKNRKPFRPPPRRITPVAKTANKPPLPPPNLKLKGVVLLGARKIAIMEGNYPVREANQSIKQKPLKKKGYALGSRIGNFELTQIEKTNVTLDNKRGTILNLNLSKRPIDKVIRKVGNRLVQKDKNFDPRKIKKAAPPRRKSPRRNTGKTVKKQAKQVNAQPRVSRISGAPTSARRLKSGAPARRPKNVPRPRISGR